MAKKSPLRRLPPQTPVNQLSPLRIPSSKPAKERKPAGFVWTTRFVWLSTRKVELNGSGQPLIGKDKGILPAGA